MLCNLWCDLKTCKLCFWKKSFTVGIFKLGTMFFISVWATLALGKPLRLRYQHTCLLCVLCTSTGVEAMTSNTILGENNPFVESANQRWLAKKNEFYRYRKQDKAEKERARLFSAEKNIQIGCSVHQLDYYRPHVLIV